MNIDEFKNSTVDSASFSQELKALWFDYQGNWDTAHDLVDQLPGKSAARVHAYLHRKEGDKWNADYWYRRAEETRPPCTLEKEWEDLVNRFLKNH